VQRGQALAPRPKVNEGILKTPCTVQIPGLIPQYLCKLEVTVGGLQLLAPTQTQGATQCFIARLPARPETGSESLKGSYATILESKLG
jgi:hypothetical protein